MNVITNIQFRALEYFLKKATIKDIEFVIAKLEQNPQVRDKLSQLIDKEVARRFMNSQKGV